MGAFPSAFVLPRLSSRFQNGGLCTFSVATVGASAFFSLTFFGFFAFGSRGALGCFSFFAFRFLPPSVPSIPRTWLSEVDVELERVNILPPDVLVTSEVEVDPARARRLRPLATFCRDARIDRAQPCLWILRYAITGGN